MTSSLLPASKIITSFPFTQPFTKELPGDRDVDLRPSNARRSRQVPHACYSHVHPLVSSFPYNVNSENLEDWLRSQGPIPSHEHQGWLQCPQSAKLDRQLLAVSPACAQLFPDLDITSEKGLNTIADVTAGQLFPPGTYAQRYGGHQFGYWAGQLGDGRAISLCNIAGYELQLKGAGRTPYSRFADGLAVTRSSIREFLGSEAAFALNIPTSRSLSLVSVEGVTVQREIEEKSALVLRISPSWLRFGSFQIHNPPRSYQVPAQDSMNKAAMRTLIDYSCKIMQVDSCAKMLNKCAIFTGKMIASWQAYGFMHGVMNTDNMSLLGLTIDYGPYAFMDIFRQDHICNHSDTEGRYSYRSQPEIGCEALQLLGISLQEYLGWECSDRGVKFENGTNDDMITWQLAGKEVAEKNIEDYEHNHRLEYNLLMARRLGFKNIPSPEVVDSLLELMQESRSDYNLTFRSLCRFDGDDINSSSQFLTEIGIVNDELREKWFLWLSTYQEALLNDGQYCPVDVELRHLQMKKVNPHFVLRQWVLEETIKKVENGDTEFLDKIISMSLNPFKDYTDTPEARLCSVGPEKMLGFQCSCSS